MKKLTSLTSKLLILGSITALSLTSAHAANAIWKGSSGSLDAGGNWTGGTGTGGIPAATQVAQFSANTTAITPTFVDNTTTTWAGISVSQTGDLTLKSSTATTATLDLGTTSTSETLITVASGSGAVTIGDATDDVNIVAAAGNAAITDTINNSSSNNLTIQNNLTTSGTNTTTLDVTGTGTTAFNGVLSNSSNAARMALTVASGATAILNANNTFTGATTINGTLNATAAGALDSGTIAVTGGTLNATVAGAVTSTTGTITLTGGTLAFGTSSTAATNAIATGMTVTTATNSTGTIVVNGSTQTIGTLTLSAGSVTTIDLGAGSKLTLDDINFDGGTLVINGWSGNITNKTSTTTIELTANGSWTQVSDHEDDISWTNATNTANNTTEDYDSSTLTGFSFTGGSLLPGGTPITPTPEPSTVFFGFGLLALLAWGGRQQILAAGRSLMLVRA